MPAPASNHDAAQRAPTIKAGHRHLPVRSSRPADACEAPLNPVGDVFLYFAEGGSKGGATWVSDGHAPADHGDGLATTRRPFNPALISPSTCAFSRPESTEGSSSKPYAAPHGGPLALTSMSSSPAGAGVLVMQVEKAHGRFNSRPNGTLAKERQRACSHALLQLGRRQGIIIFKRSRPSDVPAPLSFELVQFRVPLRREFSALHLDNVVRHAIGDCCRSPRHRLWIPPATISPIVCPITSGSDAITLSPKSDPSISERVAALAKRRRA